MVLLTAVCMWEYHLAGLECHVQSVHQILVCHDGHSPLLLWVMSLWSDMTPYVEWEISEDIDSLHFAVRMCVCVVTSLLKHYSSSRNS